MLINTKAIDNIKFIVASEVQKISKFTFLQLGKKLFKFCNNSLLSIVFKFSLTQPENSVKILFSIPIWYPEIITLEKKVKIIR